MPAFWSLTGHLRVRARCLRQVRSSGAFSARRRCDSAAARLESGRASHASLRDKSLALLASPCRFVSYATTISRAFPTRSRHAVERQIHRQIYYRARPARHEESYVECHISTRCKCAPSSGHTTLRKALSHYDVTYGFAICAAKRHGEGRVEYAGARRSTSDAEPCVNMAHARWRAMASRFAGEARVT